MMTNNDDEPRIYFRHARPFFCGTGIARILARYGVDHQDFMANGFPVAEAEKSDNPLIRKIARIARDEWERTHGQG